MILVYSIFFMLFVGFIVAWASREELRRSTILRCSIRSVFNFTNYRSYKMKKVKLRKRKRKVYFEYYPWIPLRYYRNSIIQVMGYEKGIGSYIYTDIIIDDCLE